MLSIQFLVVLALGLSTVLSAEVGERCGSDGDCVSTAMECIKRFGECEEKACWCKPNYGGRFTTGCSHKTLELGDYCADSNTQCGDGMYCHSDTRYCVCADNWRKDGDVCVDARESLGGSCKWSSNCTANMTCSGDDKCKCDTSSGYFEDGGQCREARWEEYCNSSGNSMVRCEYYDCIEKSGSSEKWCNCETSTKQVKYQRRNSYYETCIHEDAVIGIGHGEVCNYVVGEYGKYCKTEQTCSECLFQTEPTCITPGGNAVAERAHVFLILSAISAIKWI